MRYIMQRWVGGAATVLYLHFIQNFYNLSKPVWIELSGVWKLATMHILLYPSDFTLRGSVLFQVLDLRGETTRLHVCGNPNGMRHKSISLTCQTFVGQVMQHICQSSTLLQMVLVKSQSIKISVVNNSIFKPSYQFEGEQKATVSNKNAVIWLPYFCANMQRLFWAVDQFSSLEKWENVRFFSQMDEPPIYEPRVHNFSTFCVEIGVLWRYRWTSTHLWEKIPTWSRFPWPFPEWAPGDPKPKIVILDPDSFIFGANKHMEWELNQIIQRFHS